MKTHCNVHNLPLQIRNVNSRQTNRLTQREVWKRTHHRSKSNYVSYWSRHPTSKALPVLVNMYVSAGGRCVVHSCTQNEWCADFTIYFLSTSSLLKTKINVFVSTLKLCSRFYFYLSWRYICSPFCVLSMPQYASLHNVFPIRLWDMTFVPNIDNHWNKI